MKNKIAFLKGRGSFKRRPAHPAMKTLRDAVKNVVEPDEPGAAASALRAEGWSDDGLLDLIAELRDLHGCIVESLIQRCDVQEMVVYQDKLTDRIQAAA